MPYQIITEPEGLMIVITGLYSDAEMNEASVKSWEHPNWLHNRYQIVDLTGIEGYSIEQSDVAVMAMKDNIAFRQIPTKMALIAVDQSIVDLCNVYIDSVKSETMQTQIFPDEASARAWANP